MRISTAGADFTMFARLICHPENHLGAANGRMIAALNGILVSDRNRARHV